VARVIFDTNLFLTFLLSRNPIGTAVEQLFAAAARKDFDLLLPTGVIIELNSVADRPRMASRISPWQIEQFLQRVATFADLLPALEEAPPRVCRDPNDDYHIAEGIVHHADFLITRDQDLLALDTVLGMRILAPESFLKLIGEEPPGS